MSSLRLALKQSLAETGHLATQQKDKDRKRKAGSNRQRRGGRQGDRGRQQSQRSDIKKQRRREQAAAARRAQQQSLSSHLEAGGGHGDTTIHLSGSKSGHRSVSSSTLSSSSGSSSDSDSNSDDGSSSSGDDSQATSSGSDSGSNSDDGSSSDGQSSSGGEENEFQDGVFDSDSSSDEDDSDDENARLAKKQKRTAQRNSAANKIQTQWKKSGQSAAGQSKTGSKYSGKSGSAGAKKTSSSKAQTVEPPSQEVIAWMRDMPRAKQRRAMVRGLRVKVRFVTKSNRKGKDGKAIKKLKWYGGLVTDVSTGGKRIRIKYDDGTSEVSDFPDKDILVDSTGNGRHRASPEDFIPPVRKPSPRASSPANLERNEKKQHILKEISVPTKSLNGHAPTKSISETSEHKDLENQRQPLTQTTRQAPSASKASAVSESPFSISRNSVSSSGSSSSSSSSVTNDHNAQHDTVSSQKLSVTPRPSHIQISVNTTSAIPSDDRQKEKSRGAPLPASKSPSQCVTSPKPSLTIRINPPKIKKSNSDRSLTHGRQKHSPKKDPSGQPKNTNIDSSPLFSESEAGDVTPRAANEKDDLDTSRNSQCIPVEGVRNESRTVLDQKEKDLNNDSGYSTHPDHEKNAQRPPGRDSPVPPSKRRNSSSLSETIEESPSKRINAVQSSSIAHDNQGEKGTLRSGAEQSDDELPQAKRLTLKRPRTVNKVDSIPYFDAIPAVGRESEQTSISMDKRRHDNQSAESAPNPKTNTPNRTESPQHSASSGESKRKRKRERERSNSPAPTRRNSGSKSPRGECDSPTELSSSLRAGSDVRMSKPRSAVGPTSSNFDSSDPKTKKSTLITSASSSAFDSRGDIRNDVGSLSDKKSDDKTAQDGPLSMQLSEFEEKGAGKNSSVPTSRSGRKAAQKANARIVSKEEKVIVDEYSKPTKKRKEKPDLKLFPSLTTGRNGDGDSSDEDEIIEEERWVQCDRCEKWRLLPSTVQMDKLPDRWYCELNVYDPKRSSCSAPEQTTDEILKERRKAKRRKAALRLQSLSESRTAPQDEFGGSRRGSTSEMQAPFTERQTALRNEPTSSDFRDNDERRIGRSSSSDDTAESDVESSDGESSDSSKESKSGKVAQSQSRPSIADDISQYGSTSRRAAQSTSNGSSKKSKSVDDSMDLGDSTCDVVSTSKSKGGSRNRNRPRGSKESDKTSKPTKGNKKSGKEADKQQWVQCEKCEKWRRLPPNISAEDLPDVWYCSMNTWDINSASCTAEEDKLDSNVREYTITAGANLNGPSTNSGKLSYRNLIFGTGRKQNRPISERTRAAESLFSTLSNDQSNEGSGPPMVMYANSSAFQYKGSSQMYRQASSLDECEKPTFFDLMNHSHLWAELYGGAYAIQALRHEQPVFKSSEEFIHSMKSLVYHALGNNTLAGHEVLLNVHCNNSGKSSNEWAQLQASCTLELVTFALEELVKEGLVKAIHDAGAGGCGIDMIRYCRINTDNAAPICRKAVKDSRCMKIAKPWKKAGVGST